MRLHKAVRVEDEVERAQNLAAFTAGQVVRLELPRGRVYEAAYLRLHGTMTIGAAAALGVQDQGMQRAFKRVQVHRNKGVRETIRSYTAIGVNDGAASRLSSFGGVQLAREALVDLGTPVFQTDPAVGVAAHPVDILLPINFQRPGKRNRFATLLDTREDVSDPVVEIELGVLAGAAGVDTEVLNADAATTIAAALNLDLSAAWYVPGPEGEIVGPFRTRRVYTTSLNLSVNDNLPQEIDEGVGLARVMALVTDADVLSDARVTDLRIRQDRQHDLLSARWGAAAGHAKARYGVETWPAGSAVLDFDPTHMGKVQDVRAATSLDVYFTVPAGAVAADDRVFLTVEDIPDLDVAAVPAAAGRPVRRAGRR